MGSIQQFSIMAMTLGFFQLLDRKMMLPACTVCWLAIFTQSNETLLIPLGFILLLDNIFRHRHPWNNREIVIYSINSLICLVIFMKLNRISIVDQHLLDLSPFRDATKNTDIALNFFASLLSLPLSNEEKIPQMGAAGFLHLVIAIYIIFRSWKENRPLSLMIIFCILSLLTIAIVRTPTGGPVALVSRYKIFCIGMIATEIALLANILKGYRHLILISALAFITNIYGYYMNIDFIVYSKNYLEKSIMRWMYLDDISSLPLANAILDEAYTTNIFNPAKDIDYAALPTNIINTDECPSTTLQQNNLKISAKTNTSSRAVSLSVQKPHGVSAPIPDQLWLCGNRNFRVTPPKTDITHNLTSPDGQQMVILEKQLFPEDEYQLMYQIDDRIYWTTITINTAYTPQKSRDCERHRNVLQTLVPKLNAHYCEN